MGSLQALERIQEARGTLHAITLAFAKQGSELPESLRGDLEDAYLVPRAASPAALPPR